MFTTVSDRIGAACGAAFVLLVGIGNALDTAGVSQDTHPSGQQVLTDLAHQAASTSAKAGFVLEILGFVAFFGFLGYLGRVLRGGDKAGRTIAAGTAISAGLAMVVIKLGSGAPVLALMSDRKSLSPELAQMLNDINAAAFVVSWLPYAVFVGASAVALQQVSLVGRPSQYVGAALGVVGVALGVIGALDWTAGNPMAFLLGLLWLLVVSIRLAVRPGRRTPPAVESTDIRSSAPATV
jgi:hypothetical protein